MDGSMQVQATHRAVVRLSVHTTCHHEPEVLSHGHSLSVHKSIAGVLPQEALAASSISLSVSSAAVGV